jgi:hypothetical protein
LNNQNEPTLLALNLGKNQFQGLLKFIRVRFDQIATHLHYAHEFGIILPDNFDMPYYQKLGRASKIAYAKKMVLRNTIIIYQNEMAKRLTLIYNQNIYSKEGNKLPSLDLIRAYQNAIKNF